MKLKGIKISAYDSDTLMPIMEDILTFEGETEKSYKYHIGKNGKTRYLNKELFHNQDNILFTNFTNIGRMVIHDGKLSDLDCAKLITQDWIQSLHNGLADQEEILKVINEALMPIYN